MKHMVSRLLCLATVAGLMFRAQAESAGELAVEPIPDQPFTGSAIMPDLQVSFLGTDPATPLTKGGDYTVTCESNVAIGTARVTITGAGAYADAVPLETTFEIVASTDGRVQLAGDFSRKVIRANWRVDILDFTACGADGNPLDPDTYEITVLNGTETGTATVWARVTSGPLAGAFAARALDVAVVPMEYMPVDWIGSTGAQWVDTGVVPVTAKTGVDIRFGQVGGGGNQILFGQAYSWANGFMFEMLPYFNFCHAGVSGYAAGRDYHVTVAPGGIVTVDYGQGVVTNTGYSNGVGSQTLGLFAANGGAYGRYSTCRIYSFSMTQSGKTACDFIPVRRVSDDEPGFYDVAASDPAAAFHGNKGSGAALQCGTDMHPGFHIAAIPPIPYDGDHDYKPVPRIYKTSTVVELDVDDFDVTYANNAAVGMATVTVAGKSGTVYEGRSTSVTFAICEEVYVNPQCETPEAPFATPETAATSLTEAIAAAKAMNVPVKVYVAPDTYAENGFTLDGPIIIEGESRDEVIINDNTPGKRAFEIKHEIAAIRNLTITGCGFKKGDSRNACSGGHILMSAGLIENCVIKDGYTCADRSANVSRGKGGNVYISGGRLVRCQILNGHLSNNGSGGSSADDREYGAGVFATGTAVIDTCLIKNNNPAATVLGYGGGICADGDATVVNCTIAGNKVASNAAGGGIYVNSERAKVVNCVMINNGGTDMAEFGDVNLRRFFHCASSVANASCATWTVVSEGDFTSVSLGDYHLQPSSALIDSAVVEPPWCPADTTGLDLDGNSRISGKALDIGCYELDQSKVSVGAFLSAYSAFEGEYVRFTAGAKGGTGGSYTFSWDCGNGYTCETTDSVFDYAYPTSGLFTVRVKAKEGTGEWTDWCVLAQNIVVTPKTMYVNEACMTPVFPYKTRETAAPNIATILLAMTNNASAGKPAIAGATIRICEGTLNESGTVLSCPITICGDTGDPKDVIINDSVDGKRAFNITHADAVVSNLTIEGTGYRTTDGNTGNGQGGHIDMSAGRVENCVIKDGYACGGRVQGGYSRGKGGNVYMSGGRLVRCQILNGHMSTSGATSCDEHGGGIYATGSAVIDSCLIKDNNPSASSQGWGGGIYADGNTTIVNCTFGGNRVDPNRAGAGIYVNSPSVKVVNCVMVNNGGTAATEFGSANPGRFYNCASTVTNAGCATWMVVPTSDFIGVSTGDYHLQPDSALVDAGSTNTAWYPAGTATLDVEGNKRVSGEALDLGCYELDQSLVSVGGSLSFGGGSYYGGFENQPFHFTAKAKGGDDGDYSYRWDFGDGQGVTTTVAEIDRAYPASGLFTVRVSAKRGSGEWTDWVVLGEKVVVVPETMYVDETCATPVFPYKTPATAATNIFTVLLTMTNNVSAGKPAIDGATIRICAGTLNESGIVLAHPITICGDTGDPADVIINDNTVGKRAFEITHEGVAISNLTIAGHGYQQGDANTARREGGHVLMSAGLIENCVIKDGYACGGYVQTSYSRGKGGNVYMSGGRLVRCQILNGHMSINGSANSAADEFGGGVCAEGTAVVDSCLIKDNNPGATARGWGGGICADGDATVVNCTIAGNKVNSDTSGAGIYVKSATAKVVNCVMFNNGGTDKTEFGTVNLGRFLACASSVTNANCATWRVISDDNFVNSSSGNYRLQSTSALVDSGSTDPAWYPGAVATIDADGNRRVSGSAIDIGCYELDQSKISIGGKISAYGCFEGLPIHFTAEAKGGTGGSRTYRWDFGNGETRETADAEFDYAYPTSGLFTVSVAVKEAGGEWTDKTVLSQNVAVVPETMFVDSACTNAVFPYATRETAATKISTVLLAMTNSFSAGKPAVDGATIRICKGTLNESGTVLSSCAITIRGDTGDPKDVIINDNVVQKRAFTITHPDAVVRDLTITGSGYHYTSGEESQGGHILMSAGLVENCIIKDGRAYAGQVSGGYSRGQGGNVYMTGGRLVRCQILNGRMSDSGSTNTLRTEHGGGVFADGTAVLDSCLIKDNNPGATPRGWGGGVYAAGEAKVVNCTIAGNKVTSSTEASYMAEGGGIYVDSANVKVVNCVMINNGGTEKTEFGTANLRQFFHCASSVTNDSCATWTVVPESDFISVSLGDYHLQPSSVLIDSGTNDTAWCSEVATDLDVDGNPRLSGKSIDIGCYELDQSKISVGGTLSTYGPFEGGAVRFTANATGGSGGAFTYRWDFGNGVTQETSSATFDYAYPTSGLFTVRISAKEEGGDWTGWTIFSQNVVVMPETTYVDGASTNAVFPYATRETAATRISTILLAMTNNASAGKPAVPGATIRICKGTISETGTVLSGPVTVRGDTGDPKDVIINDNTVGSRAFQLTHPDAAVRDLTITGNGYHYTSDYESQGGHILMSAGLVENCVIRDGYAYAGRVQGTYSRGQGGNVYMTGGRLARCQILNGNMSNSGSTTTMRTEHGGGVFAGGTAVVESCLIMGNNQNATYRGWGGGVYAEGEAKVVNCTIIGNKVTSSTEDLYRAEGAGIYVGSPSVKVVNCVMFDNGGTDKTEFGGANLGCFVRCASSTNNESCATWQVIDETAFRAWASRDTDLRALVPAAGKPLVGTGTDAAGYKEAGGTATLDLLGNPRRTGRRVDIGCLEAKGPGSALILR